MARRKRTYDIPAILDDALIHVFQFPSYISVFVVTLTYHRCVLLLRVHLSSKISFPTFSLSLLDFNSSRRC